MSDYGFGKKPVPPKTSAPADDNSRLDLSGIVRAPLAIDPAREAAAMARGDALGFVDRGDQRQGPSQSTDQSPAGIRRRRQTAPQGSLYIKGPQETLDWFIDYTNQRGHRSYWQALAEFRELVEDRSRTEHNPDPS